jgi:hypothetical protein
MVKICSISLSVTTFSAMATSYQTRAATGPVLVAQQALVDLAVVEPWQLGDEVDRARRLVVRDALANVLDELALELRAGRDAGAT